MDALQGMDAAERTAELVRRKARCRRGAPDAKVLFESELEEHLTNLVMMMTLGKVKSR